MFTPTIGRIVHIEETGLVAAKVCHAAIVGGAMDTHLWVQIFRFGDDSMQAWLTDLKWHDPKDCPNLPTTT